MSAPLAFGATDQPLEMARSDFGAQAPSPAVAPPAGWKRQYLVSSFCPPLGFWNYSPAARSGSFGLCRASAKSCQGPLLGYGSTWSVALSAPWLLELLPSRSKWLVRTLAHRRQVLTNNPNGYDSIWSVCSDDKKKPARQAGGVLLFWFIGAYYIFFNAARLPD